MRPMDRIQEFLVSSSGSVDNRSAAGVGWLAFAVGALAAVLGTSSRASADDCHNIPLNTCDYRCLWDGACEEQMHIATKYMCHYPDGEGGCTEVSSNCGC